MTLTVDTNLLLYASDTASPFHASALESLRAVAVGPEPLYLFWPVLMGYLRIATHPAVFDQPLPPEAAAANVERLIGLPHVRTPGEDDGFWQVFRVVTADGGVRGSLMTDAHLVALMRQYGVGTILTRDRDFRKFEGIRARDPFRA